MIILQEGTKNKYIKKITSWRENILASLKHEKTKTKQSHVTWAHQFSISQDISPPSAIPGGNHRQTQERERAEAKPTHPSPPQSPWKNVTFQTVKAQKNRTETDANGRLIVWPKYFQTFFGGITYCGTIRVKSLWGKNDHNIVFQAIFLSCGPIGQVVNFSSSLDQHCPPNTTGLRSRDRRNPRSPLFVPDKVTWV